MHVSFQRWHSFNSKMSKERISFSPWPSIKPFVLDIEKKLMGLPACNAWFHERVLHTFCKVPEGPSFGPRKRFNCVIGGISKGFIGNKRGKDFINMKNSISGFDMEGASVSLIKYHNYGSKELYYNGRLCKPTFSRPKYFSTGECITNIDDQNQLVDELIGASINLPEEIAERRQHNYMSFVKQERDDGGYSNIDVPLIVYEWKDIWGAHMKANHNCVTIVGGAVRVQRRAYDPVDLEFVEGCIRLMIVGCNRYGRIIIQDGRILPSTTRAPAPYRVPDNSTTRRLARASKPTDVLLESTEMPGSPAPDTVVHDAETPSPNKAPSSLNLRSPHSIPDQLLLDT